MSSWDGSSSSHGSSSSSNSSSFSTDVASVQRHEAGSTEADRTQRVLLSGQQLGKRQPTPGLSGDQFSSRDAQQSQTSANAMRAMHDSSSSWTERSLPPKSKYGSQQNSTASGDKMIYLDGSAVAESEVVGILDTASGIEQVAMPTEDKEKKVAVTEQAAQGKVAQLLN